MKKDIRTVIYRTLIVALIFCLSPATRAALEFTAFLRSGDALHFVVTERDSGTTSGWLALGSTFETYKLVAFDERQEVLLVERDGKSIRLPLKEAHVRDGKTTLPAKIEVRLNISSDGTMVINDQVISPDAFKALLAKYAETNLPVAFYFHEPLDPGAKVHETLETVMRTVPKSGIKQYSLKIVDATPPKQ